MNKIFHPKIKELIENRRWNELRGFAREIPAPDLADVLLSLEDAERILLFSSLPSDISAEVFASLNPQDRDDLLSGMTDEETRLLLADLPPDERTQLFEDLPGQVTQRLLNLLTPDDLKEARLLLGFPEESVGRLMTPDYVAVRASWSLGQALDHIRRKGKGSETISIIYVVDETWRLLDALEIEVFILSDPQAKVEQIMDESFIALSPMDDREQAVRMMERYDVSALPVVDSKGILLGIVTVDDVLDVAREEATEDFHKVGGVTPLRISYREASVWELYIKRVGWLLILILVNLVSSTIIAAYEEVLAATIALTFFIPLLIDTGGNTGAQAASLMVRALATEDVDLSQWIRVIIKELGEGLLLGLTMGIAAIILGYLIADLSVAIVVGVTMLALVIVSNLVGIALPFLLTRFGLDPAVASSPLITTIVDAAGLLIYFSVATLILI
jgi:magnesium transporter